MAILLGSLPGAAAQATTGLEDFERCAVFDIPGTGACETSLYTFSSGGTGSNQVVSTPAVATRSLRVDGTNAASEFSSNFDTTGTDFCLTAGGGIGASFKIHFNALPPGGEQFSFGINRLGSFALLSTEAYAYFTVNDAGAVNVFAKRHDTASTFSAAFSAITLAAGTWYNFEIECATAFNVVFRSITHTESIQLTTSGGSGLTMGFFRVQIGSPGTGATTGRLFLDDIQFASPLSPGHRFCANQLETDYGYNYRRGGDYFDQGEPGGEVTGIGLSTGYNFAGTSDEDTWDYSAKGFSPTGSEAFHANITIEAGEEGASSRFRVSFNTISGAVPSVTSKGNGLNTGNFANHAEAQFTENGDRWQITLWYVTSGGTRTQLGPAVNHGSSNDARSYSIWSDNRGTTPFILVKDSAGSIVASSNNADATTKAAFQTAFAGDDIFDIWYIGYSAGILTSNTAIDNNEATAGNSTCMFDDVGTSVCLGSCGTSPADVVPPDIDPTPEDDCEAVFCPPVEGIGGLSSSQLSLFLGVVIVASFAASMNEKTGAGAAGLAIFALLGTFIAYALGYIPLWVILVLFAIGLGAIFLGLFNSGRSEAM